MTPKAPVLCLIGDIGCPLGLEIQQQSYENYLLEQADKFEHVFIVTGNHEYWSQHAMQEVDEKVAEICNKRQNLHFLNETSVVVGGV
eukprot:CAMPEP_0201511834 /NCGR_PEP_ID=MMETSP0161_2-20130828/4227_1 /ASSEMBLY_ACC=CAM_ASM_000251 /TAXON_ID=180227 /ORGANISM="Neoparamoeba aestuarina, Strain SoJaBio B1-5/56/2" /LENGTH=86 /DNA_ID=CAMNT_0047907475 /DNA_START=24 /DNA_END=281 /DNA_ORIENTATION=+